MSGGVKIKKCPFCGAAAKRPNTMIEHPFIDHYRMCWISRGITQVLYPNEIKFWNRRHK